MQLIAPPQGRAKPCLTSKFLLITRLTFLLILVASLNISAKSYGQSITLMEHHAPLEKVIQDIKAQSGYTFWYETGLLKNAKRVNAEVRNASIHSVLVLIFKGQPLSYTLIDSVVFIRAAVHKNGVAATIRQPIATLSGRVVNEKEAAIPGATIRVRGSQQVAIADNNGAFSMDSVAQGSVLIISSVGYESKEIIYNGISPVVITLKLYSSSLDTLSVSVNTGYEYIPKERATGSFDYISNKIINRSVSPDILSRLRGVTSGLLFDNSSSNDLNISIRGRSTLFANTQPVIVLDNFEYDGDINNINPNDVESITILKDAAAASIWGARSGNGVIIITTKKGAYNTPIKVSFNSNVTVTGKPNLFYAPTMSSADYISVEKYLFGQGYYDYTLTDPSEPAVTPVVEILNDERNGTISQQQANDEINALQGHDVRNDLLKYFYRKSVNQQYAVNLSGGSKVQKYYISLGYDKDLSTLTGNRNDRLTVNANNVYSLIKHKLEISTGIIFTQTKVENNGINPAQIGGTSVLYPYAQLADSKGNALPIAQHRQRYIDTVGDGQLLDWNYRPLDEIKNNDNRTNGMDYQANIGLHYRIMTGFEASVKYQYAKGETDLRDLENLRSYSTRDQINQFTEITPDGIIYPVPLGGILYLDNSSYTSQYFRGQINYEHSWKAKHQVTAIAGTEVKDLNSGSYSDAYYGYDNVHGTSVPVDFVGFYPNFITGIGQQISNGQSFQGLADRYLSYYLNAAYTYNDKYILSVSGRRDASNLFGVKTNQKWVPLWSAGASWIASDESFYHINWLPHLKLRATFGYNGNVDKNVTAFLTSKVNLFPNNIGETDANIINPPNPELRWERVKIINFGADFRLKNDRLSGSLDYYIKNGIDLIGNEELPPSTGISGLINFMGNSANTKGEGVDVVLNAQNIRGAFNWSTSLLTSWTKNKITAYNAQVASISSYINPFGITPKVGVPINALFSYKWAGLDAQGNPQGKLNGKISEDYSGIINSTDFNNLTYSGPTTPTIFGGLLNTFNWKQLSLSFNITYKLGYYFRRTSIDYTSLFEGISPGAKDFDKRWQKPGDEKTTNVPSMIYPADYYRDQFYLNSSALVVPGDHIRLQDIQFSYTFNQKQLGKTPFRSIRIYLYADNLGILWRKNKDGLDPDYSASLYDYPPSKSCAAGINIDF